MRRQARDWGKIFAKHISDNLYPKYTKNSSNWTIEKQKTQSKNGQMIWKDILPKKIDERKLSTWKDAKNHFAVENCKLK